MQYGVHKMTWGPFFDPDRPEDFFAQAKEIGADTVELRPTDAMLSLDLAKCHEMRRLLEEYGLQVKFTYGFPKHLDMRSADPFVREYATDFLIRGIRCVAESGGSNIGSAGIYACWPTLYDNQMILPEDKYEHTMRSLECVRRAVRVAEECGVTLNIEMVNRFENYLLNTVDEGLAYCRAVNSKNCNLLLDVFHLGIEENDLLAAVRKAGQAGMIGHVHVSERNRAIPQEGSKADWKGLGEALREAGYTGGVTIEAAAGFDGASSYNMRIFRDLQEDVTLAGRLRALKRSLAFLRGQMEA
ncbi:MAG: sugar phosphate isomerase/epimerase [Lachnospiraceae bacterium]|nr:sugar phosphate isomerase/epimerase [Lachnospiraceae bacterium]